MLAIQNWSNSAANLYTAIVQYNNALASLAFARGSIRERDSVFTGDGPLPPCAQVRAVEHERQRTAALVLHERALCFDQAGASTRTDVLPMRRLDMDTAKMLPALFESRPPVPELEKP